MKTKNQIKTLVTLALGLFLTAASAHAGVVQKKWTKISKFFPANGQIFEGSYLGKGEKTEASYQLHLLQYQDRPDTFIALLESEDRGTAVLGYVHRNDSDGSYQWKQITVSPDGEHVEPQPTRAPMYRLRVELNAKRRPVLLEMTGLSADSGAEIVRFKKARAALMHRAPTTGTYVGGQWKIKVSSIRDENSGLWGMEQTFDGATGETDLARYDLPGVLAVRESVNRGYEPQPQATVKWVAVSFDRVTQTFFSEKHVEDLLLFAVKDITREIRGVVQAVEATDPHDYVLVRPEGGFTNRLHFVELD